MLLTFPPPERGEPISQVSKKKGGVGNATPESGKARKEDQEKLRKRFWKFVDTKGCNPADDVPIPSGVRAGSEDHPCWVWMGTKNEDGYGQFTVDLQQRLAHRVSVALHQGSVDYNQVVLHACDNPSCVRPSHLSPGSQSENMRDMVAKGRDRWRHQRESK